VVPPEVPVVDPPVVPPVVPEVPVMVPLVVPALEVPVALPVVPEVPVVVLGSGSVTFILVPLGDCGWAALFLSIGRMNIKKSTIKMIASRTPRTRPDPPPSLFTPPSPGLLITVVIEITLKLLLIPSIQTRGKLILMKYAESPTIICRRAAT
jgi:hypothetical protein